MTTEASPPVFGWRWLDRRLFQIAYRVTGDEFRRLNGAPEVPSGRMRLPGLLVAVASVLICGAVLGCLIAGVWLCTVGFPGLALVPGLALILVAVELRPRFGRLPRDVTVVERADAPELHALVARVAEAVGAPAPHRVCLAEDEFNASAGTYGLRRRRVLTLGLPLWQVLSPQQRVALLGHEFGHYVNGDPRRGLLEQPVYRSLQALANLLRPVPQGGSSLTETLVELVLPVLLAPPRWIVTGLRIGLIALAERAGQRAEYRADVLAARVAGSAATVELLDLLMFTDPVLMLIRRDARAGVPPSAWRETAAGVLAKGRPELEARRQRSESEQVGLFATHPPLAFRARLVEGRPAESAAVVLDEATNGRIEAELAKPVARCARTLKLV